MKVTIVKLVANHTCSSAYYKTYHKGESIEVEVKNLAGLKASVTRRGIRNALFFQDGEQIGYCRYGRNSCKTNFYF